MLDRLASDRILPACILARLPVTHAPWLAIALFAVLGGILYAATSANLQTLSEM